MRHKTDNQKANTDKVPKKLVHYLIGWVRNKLCGLLDKFSDLFYFLISCISVPPCATYGIRRFGGGYTERAMSIDCCRVKFKYICSYDECYTGASFAVVHHRVV